MAEVGAASAPTAPSQDAAAAARPAPAGGARHPITIGRTPSRDFRMLVTHLPAFDADRCVGCMACVTVCPDGAILAVALPEAEIDGRIDAFADAAEEPAAAAERARAHFARTGRFADQPARHGEAPAGFGLFIDPVRCQGCGECLDVCASLGHGAVRRIPKVADEGDGMSTVERSADDLRLFRSLPPTPPAYRNEHILADLMLGGHVAAPLVDTSSCAGCGPATALRMLAAATLGIHGPDSLDLVRANACSLVVGEPDRTDRSPVRAAPTPVEPVADAALASRAAHPDHRTWIVGGDGDLRSDDALARLRASGAPIKLLILETEAVVSAGALPGPPVLRELCRMIDAGDDVYLAQTTPAHLNHGYRAFLDANAYPGPAVVVVHAACQPAHGIADDAAYRQARLAVDTRTFPLLTYDPRRGATAPQRLSLHGNPAVTDDHATLPDGTIIDTLTHARTEGRFAAHHDHDGAPSGELRAMAADRSDSWRRLQDMAGIR